MGGLDGMGLGGLDWMGLGGWLPPRKTTLPDPELLTGRRLLDRKLKLPFNPPTQPQHCRNPSFKRVAIDACCWQHCLVFMLGMSFFLLQSCLFLCNEWSLVLVENVDAR